MMSYKQLSREQLEQALKELETELEKKDEQTKEWRKRAEKVKAEFENYKKREEERKNKWKERAEEDIAEDLIEVIDNLERAIATAEEDSNVIKGVKMVADQLYKSLEKRGLKKIDAEGEEFDPKLHKAVETVSHSKHNEVVEENRKGYMFRDKVLRESEVTVGKEDE